MEYLDINNEDVLNELKNTVIESEIYNEKSGKIINENVCDDSITLNLVCSKCGYVSQIEVWKNDYDDFILNNYDVDTSFFYLSPEDRYTIKTNICKKCKI